MNEENFFLTIELLFVTKAFSGKIVFESFKKLNTIFHFFWEKYLSRKLHQRFIEKQVKVMSMIA